MGEGVLKTVFAILGQANGKRLKKPVVSLFLEDLDTELVLHENKYIVIEVKF